MQIKPVRVCIIDAPCKINLHLRIGEKRADGFHSLESLFVTLALGDTLRFECTPEKESCVLDVQWQHPGKGISREIMPAEVIPREKNLVFRALSLFRERTGFNEPLNIRLDKRIPAGSGLGGGSSDAASTLLALNLLSGAALSMEKLREIALLLGSDVPFFLTGGAAFVSGRGERVESIGSPQGLWVVLVKPPFPSDTASAFRLLDQAREQGTGKEDKIIPKETLIRALEEDPGIWPFYNDFLSTFLGLNQAQGGLNALSYRAILEKLQNLGASFVGLSGSGSCCFGIFTARERAERAEKELSGKENYVGLTFFLARKAKAVLE